MKRENIETIIAIIIILAVVIFIAVTITQCAANHVVTNEPPLGTKIEYRSVEPTGVYGVAEYFVFDDLGKRYHVSQSYFDSLKDVPRK